MTATEMPTRSEKPHKRAQNQNSKELQLAHSNSVHLVHKDELVQQKVHSSYRQPSPERINGVIGNPARSYCQPSPERINGLMSNPAGCCPRACSHAEARPLAKQRRIIAQKSKTDSIFPRTGPGSRVDNATSNLVSLIPSVFFFLGGGMFFFGCLLHIKGPTKRSETAEGKIDFFFG